jgi:Golgi phosphoprotein 3 (GPP34)
VRDGSPTGDELLDHALGVVSGKQGKKPPVVLGPLGKNLRERLYARLTECGILRAQHDKVLGLFPRHRWPTASADHEATVRRALVAGLVTGTTPDPRDAALVALLHALRLTHKIVVPKDHGLSRRVLDRRAAEVAKGSWASEAVRHAVDAMASSVTVAVGAATVATTVGAG